MAALTRNRELEDPARISVVVPAYNEARSIAAVVAHIRAATGPEFELIVVDDASSDGTWEVLDGLRDQIDVLLRHEQNQGKGAALRTGFAHASGVITIVQDADFEYDPRDYPRLIAPILDGEADVVYGSRFSGGESRRVLYFWHMVGNRLLTLTSNIFTNINLTDMETGYKAFRTEVLDKIHIQEDRFGFEPEITAKVAQLGCRIYEVGISYRGRTYADGKKIGWKDAVRTLYCILRYNLLPSQGPR